MLHLKGNHPTLHAQVQAWFKLALSHQFEGIAYSHDCRTEAGHHRREQRQVWAVPATAIPDLYQPTPWAAIDGGTIKNATMRIAVTLGIRSNVEKGLSPVAIVLE